MPRKKPAEKKPPMGKGRKRMKRVPLSGDQKLQRLAMEMFLMSAAVRLASLFLPSDLALSHPSWAVEDDEVLGVSEIETDDDSILDAMIIL